MPDPKPLTAAQVAEPKTKVNYVGAPAIFALEAACQQINDAFKGYGCFLVGSTLQRPDWRDVDVRLIMSDEDFADLFPDAYPHSAMWEHDPRWLLMTIAITNHLRALTGLPVDFQFQPATFANEWHKGQRSALGMRVQSRKALAAFDAEGEKNERFYKGVQRSDGG